ncbi:MAG: hypothetical protein LAO77_19335 [Acidobacteriia bacterium]|nr:hypothetical protein [Terriglobia bacterium]
MLNVKRALLEWTRRRQAAAYRERARAERERPEPAEPPKPRGRTMVGKYLLLYKYLENRYAHTVVLTFAEIEDLLGFALPEQARFQPEWWTCAEGNALRPHYSDSWVLASRTAVPNLPARTVVFERAS